MRIILDLSTFKPQKSKPLVLILGNFDGLHVGHRALITTGLKEAARLGGKAAVFTFLEHPQRVLHPTNCPKLLTSVEHKLFLLEEMGIQECFLTHFTKKFAELESEKFVEELLVKKLHVAVVCLGYNARFGRGRQGDVVLMNQLSKKFGFQFQETQAHKVDGEVVSSSKVRDLVESGNLEKVKICLNRPYSIFSRVVQGDGRGKSLGFPTANLETSQMTMPPIGVYPVKVREISTQRSSSDQKGLETLTVSAEPEWQQGVLNYGFRPTVNKGTSAAAVAEVHLLNFSGSLYGRQLEVEFHPQIRPEKAFENLAALKSQVLIDIEDAKSYFRDKNAEMTNSARGKE